MLRELSLDHPLTLRRTLEGIDAFAAAASPQTVLELARDPRVKWISPNRPVMPAGFAPVSRESEDYFDEVNEFNHLAVTTGARQVIATPENPSGLNGAGVGVAVIDSGILQNSCAFQHTTAPFDSRIVYWENFTDDDLDLWDLALGADEFGHGTHVSSIVGGNGCQDGSGEVWAGIAREAELMILRVLNREGRGDTSDVIAAIDRVIKHKDEFSIRVMNLSLGTTPGESYRTDPLCMAVERAVEAGIAVVVAAGNYGENPDGELIYGGILSPAIDPMVISVGAIDTQGTNHRSDDRIAQFSSRGPTQGCTDPEDVETCDLLLKPDVVAPGTYIEGLAYPGNYLYTYYPQTHLEGTRRYFYLHGTSISTPIVTGTIALMVQENRSLTPNLIKGILQYSAIPFEDEGALDQGAGHVNTAGAVEMARSLRHDLDRLEVGEAMLPEGGELPIPSTTIANEAWEWGQTIYWEWRAMYGDAPFLTMQGPWLDASSLVWGGGLTYPELEKMMSVENESFVWGGNYAWGESFVWGGTYEWGGVLMDYDEYSEWDDQLSEDPLSEEITNTAKSFVWGGAIITPETFATPNTALVDGLELQWGRDL